MGGRSFPRVVISHGRTRTPPKSVVCVVWTGGNFGKEEGYDHVMLDSEAK